MTSYSPSAAEVKAVRDITSAGMMDCKRALAETQGSVDEAVKLLRERGIAKAQKSAGRETSEGLIDAYVHQGGRVGVLVEVGCETDFVANTPRFREFVHEVALQIAAMPDTRFVRREDVPADMVDAERAIYVAQAADRPENVRARIAEGKLNSWYEAIVLIEQPWIRDGKQTIEQLRASVASELGENVQIKRFVRFQRGA
jgi:elongation factor Ts